MELVKRRPIPLPVWRNGCWYDDFAVTGAKEYVSWISPHQVIPNSIKLKASGGLIGSGLKLPSWYFCKNFQTEIVCRLNAGARFFLEFRYLNDSNRMRLRLQSDGTLAIIQVVSGTYTTVATYTGVTSNKWLKIGMEAVGTNINVFANGIKVLSISNSTNMGNGNFTILAEDNTVNTVDADVQYLAIKPL